MERLACKDAEKGLVVVLTHPNPDYIIGRSNPVLGSEYECTGAIAGVNLEFGFIQVIWGNGQTNEYVDKELSTLVSKEKTGRCRSIW